MGSYSIHFWHIHRQIDANLDSAYHFEADPTFQFDADRDQQHWLEFVGISSS
jgi:hypothetical protein